MRRIILESPDGGETFLKVVPGSPVKEQVEVEFNNTSTLNDWTFWMRNVNWSKLSAEYPTIDDKLKELKALYYLCKK
jgi:hypothetical protein